MTYPQFDDTPSESLGGEKRDPSEYVPWPRVAEVKTPRGTRPGLVMIVRPLERIRDYRDKNPENDWKTLVIADIAILDAIGPGADEYGMPLDPIPAGSQWRNQTVFPGMLNKAWRDKIGNTLIGQVYMGEPKPTAQGTMGKAPFLWRSLAQDPNATTRGQRFFMAFPGFLIPVPRVAPAVPQESWATQATLAPAQVAPTTEAWQQPGYQGPDPWASAAPAHGNAPQGAPVSAPPQHPNQGMSTIDQLKAEAAQRNAQGMSQTQDPPF